MAAKKAASGSSGAAAAEKKRKRDKTEDSGRLRKRKPQEAATSSKTKATQAAKADEAADAPKSEKPSSTTSLVVQSDNDHSSSSSQAITNGIHGDHSSTNGILDRPSWRGLHGLATTWKLSEPMGGHMADIDPIFSPKEDHLIIAYRDSVQVFSTSDSLLVRRIALPSTAASTAASGRLIVATALSPRSPQLVWIGCADGSLFRADWTTGAVESMARARGHPTQLVAMTAELVELSSGLQELLFLSEGPAWRVAVYDAATLAETPGQTIFTPPSSSDNSIPVECLRTADNGRFIVGVCGPTVLVGGLTAAAAASAAQLAYQVFSMTLSDGVCSLDVRAVARKAGTALDVVVGCVRGAIYIYGDVLGRLQRAAAEGSRKRAVAVHPRKLHWHSQAVHAVKWSRDGNYILSGGTETVLVLWQTDTGRHDFLPHLTATIENIVVSPRGSSYAVHLDSNATMVVSTAEMQPTCYVSGLQSLTLSSAPRPSAAAAVRRVWQPVEAIVQPVPAVVDPADASRLWLRVGSSQRYTLTTPHRPSASLLQTFDVTAFQGLARQPLARTNPTDARLTPRGQPLTEPTITRLCASHDGRWLVSVDEWQPPERDISSVAGVPGENGVAGEWARERREVHLCFWAVDGAAAASVASSDPAASSSLQLVTRVDQAHFTTQAESILAVVADPRHASRFATLGHDGAVRFWGVKKRVQNGLAAKDAESGDTLVSWFCLRNVLLPLGEGARASTASASTARKHRGSGALAFSEDGSTVLAAFGTGDADGEGGGVVLYVIDAETGVVRKSLPGLFRGPVRGLEILGSALILLSADLRVYDIVADELRYGLRLLGGGSDDDNSDEAPVSSAMAQLAVGRLSRTFIVAVPYQAETATKKQQQQQQHRRAAHKSQQLASRLLVFSPDRVQPLFVRSLPNLVVSLLPAVGLSGFLAIDAAAQIMSVVDVADTSLLGRPLSELNLPALEAADEDAEAPLSTDLVLAAEPDSDDDMDEADAKEEADDDDDDDDDDGNDFHAVIAPQQLRDIFEAAPATASTSMEDLFWQVSRLLIGQS